MENVYVYAVFYESLGPPERASRIVSTDRLNRLRVSIFSNVLLTSLGRARTPLLRRGHYWVVVQPRSRVS